MLPLMVSAAAAPDVAVPVNAPPTSPDVEGPRKLRTGIVLGFSFGAGAGEASGYPNQSSKIGDPDFYSASGFMSGGASTFFVMGALSDYLNFGFWFGSESYKNGDWRSNSGGGGLKVEAFPFERLFPALSGLGALALVGIGSGNLDSTHAGHPESSGTQSFLGTGAFYEWGFGHILGGHFGLGPSLEYDAVFSRPFESHGLVASARVVFYGGP